MQGAQDEEILWWSGKGVESNRQQTVGVGWASGGDSLFAGQRGGQLIKSGCGKHANSFLAECTTAEENATGAIEAEYRIGTRAAGQGRARLTGARASGRRHKKQLPRAVTVTREYRTHT